MIKTIVRVTIFSSLFISLFLPVSHVLSHSLFLSPVSNCLVRMESSHNMTTAVHLHRQKYPMQQFCSHNLTQINTEYTGTHGGTRLILAQNM